MTSCRLCKNEFSILEEDLQVYQNLSPRVGDTVLTIPPPTLCPDCRLQRRMSFRNERNLYRRACAVSGKQLLSVFSEEGGYKVISPEVWWSGGAEASSYGRAYDPSRSFFDQVRDLAKEVPHLALNQKNAENSEYTTFSLNVKNCYLSFGATDAEGCIYCKTVANSRDIVDGLGVRHSELCYEMVNCERCSFSAYLTDCRDCSESYFLEACESCSHCILCVGLYRKEYCIENEYVGKERYEAFLKKLLPLSRAVVSLSLEKLSALEKKIPIRASYIFQSEDCTGDLVYQSKHCEHSFNILGGEDSKFLFWTPKAKNSYDCTFNSPDGVEECYEACSTLGIRHLGTFFVWNGEAVRYSMECINSQEILGCVGLQRGTNCILNKAYTKAEYEKLVRKIYADMVSRGEWGEYMPPKLSWFSYDETVAFEYFPLSEQEATERGFNTPYRVEGRKFTEGKERAPDKLPADSSALLQRNLRCEATGRSFKIVPYELEVLKKLSLPPPSLCPDVRHKNRVARGRLPKLATHQCALCSKTLLSSYSIEIPRLLLCEECFLSKR